ncbi:chromobox protein 1-like protein [Leptotrombidium deliense]|uniref:Chromobox protein 1-like protein n=1 Tax=Leptotrombidium deliense TaxID=299467 RepID=A0A443RZ50_9ACAR|nr:chromobox protein 1-like protein [Leptotrombidium deliense]
MSRILNFVRRRKTPYLDSDSSSEEEECQEDAEAPEECCEETETENGNELRMNGYLENNCSQEVDLIQNLDLNRTQNEWACEEIEPDYKIERILGKRVNGGNVEYYLKWEGYDESYNTWEPEENLSDADHLIAMYENDHVPPQTIKVARKSTALPANIFAKVPGEDDSESDNSGSFVRILRSSERKLDSASKAIDHRKEKSTVTQRLEKRFVKGALSATNYGEITFEKDESQISERKLRSAVIKSKVIRKKTQLKKKESKDTEFIKRAPIKRKPKPTKETKVANITKVNNKSAVVTTREYIIGNAKKPINKRKKTEKTFKKMWSA